MDKVFWQRFATVFMGLCAIMLAFAFRADPSSHDALLVIGAGLVGVGGVKRPGDSANGAAFILLCLFAGLTLTPVSCKQLNGLWPAVAKCTTPSDLIGVVSQILLTRDDYQAKLEELTRNSSQDVSAAAEDVICIVDTLVNDWSRPDAAANQQRMLAVARGKAFLKTTGTRVER